MPEDTAAPLGANNTPAVPSPLPSAYDGGFGGPAFDLGGDAFPSLDPAGSSDPAASDAAPAPIVVKGKSYAPDEAAELIEKGQSATQRWQEAAQMKREAEAQLAQMQPAIQLAQTWQGLDQATQTEILQLIERKAAGGAAPAVPAVGPYKDVAWDDMSDEARMIFALVSQQRQEIQQLSSILAELRPEILRMSTRDQDAMAVQALGAKGHAVTQDQVRAMRAAGITDPVRAYELFAPMMQGQFAAGAKAAAAAPQAPAEAPAGDSNVFDDDDPNLTADQMIVLLQKGFVPKSSLTNR